MEAELFERIVSFVKHFVDDMQRERYVRDALFGSSILDHVKWDNSSPVQVFASSLVDTIYKKGERDDLCRLIVGLAKNGGEEHRRTAESLCREIRRGLPDLVTDMYIDNRYKLLERLGEGGNGEVWKAQEQLPDGKTVRIVAIKILKREVSASTKRIERFKKEISLTCRIIHPHIVRTIHWGEVNANFYAVMDYVDGETLQKRISGRKFTDTETVQFLTQIAEALDVAHRMKLVHRDVKPENILVKDDTLFLSDFGLAITNDETNQLTESGEWVGTKKYMAPEQWECETATPQTDIYALGLIAYEMLTGHFPFDASSPAALMRQHLDVILPADAALPEELLRILRRATAKQQIDRYSGATEFLTELSHWHLDPANLETIIAKYLATLTYRLQGEAYERFFVNLSGDVREVLPVAGVSRRENVYRDPYLEKLLREFAINLSAEERAPSQTTTRLVPNIVNHLLTSRRVVLIGEPGAGKSFILRRLAMEYIAQYPGRIPVFVPLNDFKGNAEQTFENFVKEQMGPLSHYYKPLIAEGRLVLICDALNEMSRSSSTGHNLVSDVRSTLAEVPHFVVSCRIRDYDNDLDELKLERLEVRDMDLPTILEFLQKYLRDDAAAFWQRIGGSDDLLKFWHDVIDKRDGDRFWREDAQLPDYTSPSADKAWRQMWQGAKLIPLARNPYLAQMICTLHRSDRIPDNRAELYEAFVTDLYDREVANANKRSETFPSKEALESFLTELANRMQSVHTTVLEHKEIESDLLQAALDTTILTQQDDKIRFTHQLLQEYFSARILAPKMYADEDPQPLIGDEWWILHPWRETALMLAEFTDDVECVASWIGRASPELALETLRHSGGDHALAKLDQPTRNSLIDNSRAKANEPNPLGRASIYRVLGVLNADNRVGIGVAVVNGTYIPSIDWCEVPHGYFKYGGDSKAFQSAPAQEIYLETFYIARYPITYLQFQAFIDDPEGIADERWWVGLARNYKTPFQQEWPISNHPRENINWYQTIAFCRWFSWRLGGSYDINRVMEWKIRLPTEQEWEKAARGSEGRYYPYGSEFDNSSCVTRELDVRQTTAVGIFPSGQSPYGVNDMSGNVWDWCLTDFRSGSNSNFTSHRSRVLRGGSWNHDPDDARCADRDLGDPSDKYFGFGFRVCTSKKPEDFNSKLRTRRQVSSRSVARTTNVKRSTYKVVSSKK